MARYCAPPPPTSPCADADPRAWKAQVAWARELQTNSRFVGVEPGNPDAVVPPGVKLTQIDSEETLPEVSKTQELARQLIR